MPRQRITEEDILRKLEELKIDAENYGKKELARLIDEFLEKYKKGEKECPEDYVSKLRKDLKKLPKDITTRIQTLMVIFTRQNEENMKYWNEFTSITKEIAEYSDERLLSDAKFREWFINELNAFNDICHKIINMIYEETQKMGIKSIESGVKKVFDIAKNENEWFRACLNNELNNLFNKLYECITQNELRTNLELLRGSENILDLLQMALGLPVNIIQHRPMKYVHYRIGDKRDSVPLTEIFYSLLPFNPLNISREGKYIYYLFVPKEEYVSYREFPEVGIAEPQEIGFVKVGDKPIRYGRRFIINIGALRGDIPFYACRLGFGPIAITSDRCTYANCHKQRDCFDINTNKYRYLIKLEDFLRVYHVYPSIKKDVKLLERETLSLGTVLGDGGLEPIVRVSIDNASAVIKLNSVIFSPREKYQYSFYREPELKIRLKPRLRTRSSGGKEGKRDEGLTLGMILTNSNALVIRFDTKVLREIIRMLLNNDEVLRRYIYVKMRAAEKEKDREKDREEELLNAVDYIAENLSNNGNKNDGVIINDELLNFSMRVFAHTLGHVLLTYLSAKLQVEPLALLDYYYEVRGDYVTVAVYELGEGGLGLLERSTLANVLSQDILIEVLNHLKLIDRECERRIESSKKIGAAVITNNNLKALWKKYVNNPTTKIVINAQTLRHRAYRLVDEGKASKDEMEDFLSNVPVCMDGCVYCVLLERGCSEPLTQQFTTSRRLLLEVLEEITKRLSESHVEVNKALSEPGENRENLFMKFLGLANNELKLMTYVIDEHMAEKLIELRRSKPRLRIRLLINGEKVNELFTVIDRLRRANIEVKALGNLHGKVYIVDDALVLEGSMNLTRKGLRENMENLILISTLKDVNDKVHQFEEHWRQANEISNNQ